MKIAPRIVKVVPLLALAFLPTCVSAQSFQIVSRSGSVFASAFVSSPDGGDSDSDEKPVPDADTINISALANPSVFPGVSAIANSGLAASFTSTMMSIGGSMGADASVSNTLEQSAGATAGLSMQTVFTVDAPTALLLTGESHRNLSGDGSAVNAETNIVLRAGTETLVDLSGIDGTFEFQSLLQSGVTYTLTTSGIANSAITQDFSSASTSGSFNVNLTASPVPAPNSLAIMSSFGSMGLCFLARRRR